MEWTHGIKCIGNGFTWDCPVSSFQSQEDGMNTQDDPFMLYSLMGFSKCIRICSSVQPNDIHIRTLGIFSGNLKLSNLGILRLNKILLASKWVVKDIFSLSTPCQWYSGIVKIPLDICWLYWT